ncbi:MAG: tetratricopeptide repeat protein, partial [Cytophagales bacterium]|nr:tetratricopeptide repeat protein [Armatimonadota bacterium]
GSAGTACQAAITLQESLLFHLWPDDLGPLQVRAAVHAGPADLFHGDYYGATIGQATRLMEAANPGQILLSKATQSSLSPQAGWRVTSLGSHRLRDLGEPMTLFQLSRDGLPDTFDPPRTLDIRRQNLPVQVTSFVGRESETAAVRSLLVGAGAGQSAHLVTLYGPGGVGKTRLALQVAAECVDDFPGGVWFVPLAEAHTESDVVVAVAEVLRVPAATGKRDLTEQVVAALNQVSPDADSAAGRVLLLLDNLETALPAAGAFVRRLLRDAPHCALLVTSRVLVQVRGEQRFEVSPLAVPSDREAHLEAAVARSAAAVALFRARAREVSVGFDRPKEAGGSGIASLPLLCSICRKLDGLPLAIELAAARARHLSLAEIDRRLEDVFSLLVTRVQDVPERQRTLLAALQWSYDLLDGSEQRFLERLSVFSGGFTEEGAGAVTGHEDAFELLVSLEEKSLVRCVVAATEAGGADSEGDGDGASSPPRSRFSLLNMIQTFARRRLAERGEEADAVARHAGYYRHLVAQAAPALGASNEVLAFDTLDQEMDNLRAAYAVLCGTEPDAVPAFVANVGEFARRRGHWREWFEWPRHALKLLEARQSGVSPEVQGRLHLAVGIAAKDLGDMERAERQVASALWFATLGDSKRLQADALNLRGVNLIREKRFEDASAALREAESLYRDLGNARGEAAAGNNLGLAALRAGDYPLALRHFQEAADLCKRTSDSRGFLTALNNLAMIALETGEPIRARDLFSETLALCRGHKDAVRTSISMMNLGDAMEQCGDADGALPLLVAAEQIFGKLGHPHREDAEKYLARCEGRCGAAAIEALREDYARRPLAALLTLNAAPAPRRLTLEPKVIQL